MAAAEVVAMAATTKAGVSTRNAVMSVRATDVMMTGRVNMVGTVVDNTMVRPLYLAERGTISCQLSTNPETFVDLPIFSRRGTR